LYNKILKNNSAKTTKTKPMKSVKVYLILVLSLLSLAMFADNPEVSSSGKILTKSKINVGPYASMLMLTNDTTAVVYKEISGIGAAPNLLLLKVDSRSQYNVTAVIVEISDNIDIKKAKEIFFAQHVKERKMHCTAKIKF
jgi:hypothetical protein